MRWIRVFARATIAAVALSLVHAVALACTCAGGLDPDWEDAYDTVFVGEATRSGGGCGGMAGTTFVVEEAFVGAEPGERLRVEHRTNGAECGLTFADGERYLVFATELDGGLQTSLCAPGGPIDEQQALIRFLRGE